MKKCKYCNGTGRKPIKIKHDVYGQAYNQSCPHCYGKGVKQ